MVFEKLVNIISKNLGIDPKDITLDTNFDELGVDSLDLVELVMDIEDKFQIKIDEEDDFKTVGDIVSYIESQLEKAED